MEFSIEPAQCRKKGIKEREKDIAAVTVKASNLFIENSKEVKFISTNSTELCVYFVSNHHHGDYTIKCGFVCYWSRVYIAILWHLHNLLYAIYDTMCDLSNYNWIFWGNNKDEISHEQINIIFLVDGRSQRIFVHFFDLVKMVLYAVLMSVA